MPTPRPARPRPGAPPALRATGAAGALLTSSCLWPPCRCQVPPPDFGGGQPAAQAPAETQEVFADAPAPWTQGPANGTMVGSGEGAGASAGGARGPLTLGLSQKKLWRLEPYATMGLLLALLLACLAFCFWDAQAQTDESSRLAASSSDGSFNSEAEDAEVFEKASKGTYLQENGGGEQFSVELDRSGGMPVGVDSDFEDGRTLLVNRIHPDRLLAGWNAAHLDRQIRVGDRIVEVNGRRGDAYALMDEMRKHRLLWMRVWRPTPQAAAGGSGPRAALPNQLGQLAPPGQQPPLAMPFGGAGGGWGFTPPTTPSHPSVTPPTKPGALARLAGPAPQGPPAPAAPAALAWPQAAPRLPAPAPAHGQPSGAPAGAPLPRSPGGRPGGAVGRPPPAPSGGAVVMRGVGCP